MDPIGREDGKGVRGRGALGVWDRRRGDGVAGSGFLEEAGEGPPEIRRPLGDHRIVVAED
jgi:hypothetical protein